MTTYSNLLRLALQETGENDETWGETLNNGVFELIEDSIAGLASISVTSGNVTLTANNGATDQARNMILILTGSPGSSRNVIVPAASKLYLVRNDTTGDQTITVKTSAGSGVAIPAGASIFVYCDGTDVVEIEAGNAVSATNADSASNADALGGVAAANYARLDVGGSAQQFSRSQSTARTTLTPGTTVSINAQLSNCFRLTAAQNFTLANPTNGVDGQTIRIVIKQDATGSRVITWGTKYRFAGGVEPTLSTGANDIDYFSFEYLQSEDIWVGGGLLDLS